MEDPRWNLDELAERVDAALAVGYRGQPSGRVRAVPDRRAIRWYTTIGLIDRPLAYRGRTALYGPRHLLQLVAVKRLQAKGLPLVAIQQELAAATDTQLARVAHLPAGTGSAAATPAVAPGGTDPAAMAPAAGDGGAESRPGRAATGIASAADPEQDGGSRTSGAAAADDGGSRADGAAVPDSGLQADGAAVPGGGGSRIGGAEATERTAARTATGVPRVARATAARRAGFWRQQPAAAMAASTGPERTDPERTDTVVGDIATLQGIRLGEGATLLLEPGRNLDAADVHAILDAAGPLLSALRERGFTGTVGASPPTSTTSTSPPLSTPTPPRPPARRRGGNEPREPRREQS